MFAITLSSRPASITDASTLSITVVIRPCLPATRRASSSTGHGWSSALCSTSKRRASASTTSGKMARATRTLFTLLVQDLRQPEADLREEVQQDQRDHLYSHERHHA